jgi:hypothetical protein
VSHFSLEKEWDHVSFLQALQYGSHDLLREKPSLFILSGRSSISVPSLMMCYLHPDLMDALVVLLDPGLNGIPGLSNGAVFKPKSFLTDQRKLKATTVTPEGMKEGSLL